MSIDKILIDRHDCHGDVLAATAVLPGLRKLLPDAQIDWYADEPFDWSLKHNPFIDRVMTRPRRDSYDLVIVLDHHVRWTGTSAEVSVQIVNEALSEALGEEIDIGFHKPQLYFTPEELEEPLPSFTPPGFIAVAWRAGWENKCFPLMQKVIDAFPAEQFVQVEAVEPKHRLNCAGYLGDRDLREVARIMRDCKLYVGTDTAFAHIAVALGKPMVLALGPTSTGLVYLPHASVVYDPHRLTIAMNHLPGDYPVMDAKKMLPDLINALGERLGGNLAGTNPNIYYTDGDGRDWRP